MAKQVIGTSVVNITKVTQTYFIVLTSPRLMEKRQNYKTFTIF